MILFSRVATVGEEMSYVNTHHDTDPLAWSGLNLQYLLGKVDWLSSQQEETEDKMRHLHNWDQAPALETAFLGPQLWDKKVNMKIFGHETGSSSAQSESPSPPHFQPQVGGVSSEGARWESDCVTGPPLPPRGAYWAPLQRPGQQPTTPPQQQQQSTTPQQQQ